MNKTWIVTSETYIRQTKSWSFLMLVLMPFIVFGFSFGMGYLSASQESSNDIAVVSASAPLRQAFIKDSGVSTTKKYATKAAAQKATDHGDITGYLVLNTTKQQQVQATFKGPDSLSSANRAKVQQFLQTVQTQLNIKRAKITTTQQQQLALQPKLTQTVQKKTSTDKSVKFISFYIIAFFVYLILSTYTGIMAQEIAAEKGTKIMEVILSSTTARKYFNGKIYGVLLMILTQALIYFLGGVAGLAFVKNSSAMHAFWQQWSSLIEPVLHNIMSINLLFALAAVLLYTIFAAFCGALVTRVEDASKASQPVIYLNLLALTLGLILRTSPTNIGVTILSYVPFFSSYFMPLRLINHVASFPEAVTSLVILIITIIASMLYIGKIYGGLMLQTDELGFWGNLKRGLHLK
ncbi:ABC transporter permease [Lactiplantibacillus fabifermentans]|uniref:ABC transporter permease n=1 Tax=Lactiplantibacillus fabifermentans T30PCM01 TaxID=1400520 RepID=W6T5H6_9LACO|nr:ABC transporter permease [Lactiplantibacillus fabifermentans]ETY73361.1 ABC transporter permease [Lactiplantibacillus fabifermentans T30PCM01]